MQPLEPTDPANSALVLRTRPTDHGITVADRPGVAPNDARPEPHVLPPHSLRHLPDELKLTISAFVPLSGLAAWRRTCRYFNDFLAPAMEQAHVTHLAAKARSAMEVIRVVGTPGEKNTILGLEDHQQAEPLIALGHSIGRMHEGADCLISLCVWVATFIRLAPRHQPPAAEIDRIGEPTHRYRPSRWTCSADGLDQVALRLREQRHPEAEVQATLDTLGVWMQAIEKMPLPITMAPLLQLVHTLFGPAALARVAMGAKLSILLHAGGAPARPLRDALTDSVKAALIVTRLSVAAVEALSADPGAAPMAHRALAVLPKLERLFRLDPAAPATRQALDTVKGDLQAAMHPVGNATWQQLSVAVLTITVIWAALYP